MLKQKIPQEAIEQIAIAAQLAILLEVSGYPKPGNIHRLHDFEDTKYEHFVASGIAIGPLLKKIATQGAKVGLNLINPRQIGIGKLIKDCIKNANEWHHGRNTILGLAALIAPLTAGAGITLAKCGRMSLNQIRRNTAIVMRSSTVQDAIDFYDAVKNAGPGGLKRSHAKDAPNVHNVHAKKELKKKNLTLYDIMNDCASYDDICKEWTSNMNTTFKLGYPTLTRTFRKFRDINIATVHTFLTILSSRPDTLITRKTNLNTSLAICKEARNVLEKGGLTTVSGEKSLKKLDRNLRKRGNALNPGTTADLTAASLMVAILCGLRP
ncbi:MAG: triphosphoribosyl-dephospho-CoA synthase [Candidatus Bathyarchaeota archaeon]